MNIFLFGKHSNRTPLAYRAYRALLPRGTNVVDDPAIADCVVCGRELDLREQGSWLLRFWEKKGEIPVFVVSEEPLWESVWTPNPSEKYVTLPSGLRFKMVGYFSSRVFEFVSLPYYLTTEDHFLARYVVLLNRQLQDGPDKLAARWTKATSIVSFFLEKRFDHNYEVTDDNGDLIGLSIYRSALASSMRSIDGIQVAGRGWTSDERRQNLTDWHLDKLSRCSNSRFLGSIENTYHSHYITEKPFDALAVGSLPITWGPPNSRIWDFLNRDACVNVAGESVAGARKKILDFRFDRGVAEIYLGHIAWLLKEKLTLGNLHEERLSLIRKLFVELEH